MVLNTLNWPGYSLFDVNDTDSSVIACNRSTRLNIANETTFHKALREIFDKGVARACTRSDRLILFVVEASKSQTSRFSEARPFDSARGRLWASRQSRSVGSAYPVAMIGQRAPSRSAQDDKSSVQCWNRVPSGWCASRK